MQTIQAQNDAFRRGMFVNLDKPNKAKPAGRYAVSAGVHALPPDAKALVLAAVRNFDNFTEDNDSFGEHEFGNIELPNLPKVFWRIDYYADENLEWGAENPAESCYRLLTIYLASEH